MSADEDTELRDLVSQTLETNGVLGKIRVRFMLFYTLYVRKTSGKAQNRDIISDMFRHPQHACFIFRPNFEQMFFSLWKTKKQWRYGKS